MYQFIILRFESYTHHSNMFHPWYPSLARLNANYKKYEMENIF